MCVKLLHMYTETSIILYICAINIYAQDTAFQVVKFLYLLSYSTPIINLYFCCNVLTSFNP